MVLSITACNQGSGNNGGNRQISLPAGEVAEICFREYEHDFGKVTEGGKIAYIFPFDNKGPGRLVISSATTTCGCTVTRFDKNPILPGESGTLEVVFDTAGRSGKQTKTVSVRSNSKREVVILKITAEVIPEND